MCKIFVSRQLLPNSLSQPPLFSRQTGLQRDRHRAYPVAWVQWVRQQQQEQERELGLEGRSNRSSRATVGGLSVTPPLSDSQWYGCSTDCSYPASPRSLSLGDA